MLICVGDYCDVYLTHDSMSVRKAHNNGRNHLRNVVDYYQRKRTEQACQPEVLTRAEIGHEKAQSVIDSITNSYAAEGQAASNPMLGQNPGAAPFPPPFGFPGGVPPPFPGMPAGMLPRMFCFSFITHMLTASSTRWTRHAPNATLPGSEWYATYAA